MLVADSSRVRVYKNIRTGLYSVKDKSGLVKYKCSTIILKDVEYIVSQKGKLAVIKTGIKNVHAFIEGYIIDEKELLENFYSQEVTYNPFKYSSFVESDTKIPVLVSDFCVLEPNFVYAIS
jgi:hypothetical protein